ncbi:MAG: histidine--tRNA ligase [Clostridiales bacterium]|jgi:histidyl-tRNA synthetase|nr:histidine--tRNA ligase [Clostridiales bacterium]
MFNRPRGTEDILPNVSHVWQNVENSFHNICQNFGYKEIRTPLFERTEVFLRGIGNNADIVQKEMYTFLDKGQRSMTLKPEGTASIVRCYIENNMQYDAKSNKLYYITPCYRYERPQIGRLREFHQFGVENLGSEQAICDSEVISLSYFFLESLGIKNLILLINSIGCENCRDVYKIKLKDYFGKYIDNLCSNCKTRINKNPMRILDCKKCFENLNREIIDNSPKMIKNLCEDCLFHFENVKKNLENIGVKYQIDSKIVRGLDYYTRTVFEIICDIEEIKFSICGGGRYNGLVKELGGNSTCGMGFGIGIERLIHVLYKQNIVILEEKTPLLFVIGMNDLEIMAAQKVVYACRLNGIFAEMDLMNRSVKVQMKYANKIGSKFVMVIGKKEIESNKVKIKNMKTKNENEIVLNFANIKDDVYKILKMIV